MNDLFLPRSDLLFRMIRAHQKTAEALAFDSKQIEAWIAAGKPTKTQPHKRNEADGYDILSSARNNAENWLTKLRSRIEFITLSVDDPIFVSYEDFVEYTNPILSL